MSNERRIEEQVDVLPGVPVGQPSTAVTKGRNIMPEGMVGVLKTVEPPSMALRIKNVGPLAGKGAR